MNTAIRKKNESMILWEPVSATKGAFTAIECVAEIQHFCAQAESVASSMFVNAAAAPIALDHAQILKAAKKLAPEQSWFEEDFTNVRHPHQG